MIDENLDLSASLFDQHTLFSQILTMKFFDKIKDIKQRQERRLVRIKSALKTLADEITTEAIQNAKQQLEVEYMKIHESDMKSDDEHASDAVQRFIGGVSINVNDQNIFDTYADAESELDSGKINVLMILRILLSRLYLVLHDLKA